MLAARGLDPGRRDRQRRGIPAGRFRLGLLSGFGFGLRLGFLGLAFGLLRFRRRGAGVVRRRFGFGGLRLVRCRPRFVLCLFLGVLDLFRLVIFRLAIFRFAIFRFGSLGLFLLLGLLGGFRLRRLRLLVGRRFRRGFCRFRLYRFRLGVCGFRVGGRGGGLGQNREAGEKREAERQGQRQTDREDGRSYGGSAGRLGHGVPSQRIIKSPSALGLFH